MCIRDRASEALSHVESALSHAYAVLEHSFTRDIKLHPPDKSHLNSPPLSVTSASPKSPFDKVAQFSIAAVLITYVEHCTLARRRNISIA